MHFAPSYFLPFSVALATALAIKYTLTKLNKSGFHVLLAKPGGAPALSCKKGKEGSGEELADEEPQDARSLPTSAAAAPEQIYHLVSWCSLLFDSLY